MATFTLTDQWQQVASAGQTVAVMNRSSAPVLIMTSTGAPPAASDGLELSPSYPSEQLSLTADLYARCESGKAILAVMGGISLGGSGASPAPATPTAAPGGGPNNVANFADPNNSYLAGAL